MKKRAFFLPLFFLLMAFISDEKSLRLLHEKAEKALSKENFAEAKNAYEELLKHVSVKTVGVYHKYAVDWPTYVDIVVRLGKIYLKLELFPEGENLVDDLLKKEPPPELYSTIVPLRARFLTSLKKSEVAHASLIQLSEQIPLHEWNNEDRSFFRGLYYMLVAEIESLVLSGEKNFSLLAFEEAKEAFAKALSKIQASKLHFDLKEKVFLRLCECHFHLGNYDEALFHLHSFPSERKSDALFLKALTYKQKGETTQALSLFEEYLQQSDGKVSIDFNEKKRSAKFEMALLAYGEKNFEKARMFLLELEKEKESQPLASLYLARILLKESKPLEATELLLSLTPLIQPATSLYHEWLFLLGAAFFEIQDYASSIDYFQRSTIGLSMPLPWEEEACYRQGIAYYKLGMDRLKQEKIRRDNFIQAKECFLRFPEIEKCLLALGRVYHQLSKLGDKEAATTLSTYLKGRIPTLSVEAGAEAFYLLASSNPSEEEREGLLLALMQEKYAKTPFYPEAWYEYGLLKLSLGKSSKETLFLDQAIHALKIAGGLFAAGNHRKADSAYWYLTLALYYRNTPASSLAALSYLDALTAREPKEEYFYLKGLTVAKIARSEGKPHSMTSAKGAFSACLNFFPQGQWQAEALFAQGAIAFDEKEYRQSGELFLQLVASFPSSPFADEALYFAIESLEREGGNEENVLQLRTSLYTSYPHSVYADETYLRVYPLASYLSGEKEAIGHLLKFSSHFPHSAYMTASEYFLALYYKDKDLLHSLSLFKNAVLSFDEKIKPEDFPILSPSLILFRYRSLFEIAKIHMECKSYNEALHLLDEISANFEEKKFFLSTLLYNDRLFPPLYQQTLLTAAHCHLALSSKEKAQEIFSSMLLKFAEVKINRNAILARVWFEEGKLALEKEDYPRALGCFDCSASCGHNLISIEEKLTLWMLKSQVFRGLGDFTQAMRMLSSIINEDVASPLRVQAMLQRAEIYELQGRNDLAIRQLQAVSKKGGEYGKFASDTLMTKYGIV